MNLTSTPESAVYSKPDNPSCMNPGPRPILIFIFACLTACGLRAQTPELVTLEKLQSLIHSKDRTVQVVNFWATWCAPCVKEMPMLEKLNKENSEVKVTLVSMDLDLDPNPEKVYKFVERKKLQSKVVILNARDPNSYIDKIEKKWSGALPATLVVNTSTGKRAFHEGELHDGDLEKLVDRVK